MLTDSIVSEQIEGEFLTNTASKRLYHFVANAAGISYQSFRILCFNHLLMYVSSSARSCPVSACVAFMLGYLWGCLTFAFRRTILAPRLADVRSVVLVVYSPSPNQRAQVAEIRREYPNANIRSQQACGFRQLATWKIKADSVIQLTPCFRLVSVFARIRAAGVLLWCVYALSKHTSVATKHWLNFGFMLSPVLDDYARCATQLATMSVVKTALFTDYSFTTSLIAEKLNEANIETISWLHGIVGFAFAQRSVCTHSLALYSSDLPFLRRFSFSKTYSARCDDRILATPKQCDDSRKRIWDELGYATNMLAGEGDMPCGEEKHNPFLADAGHMCNRVVADYVKSQKIKSIHLRLHPRERMRSYVTWVNQVSRVAVVVKHKTFQSFIEIDPCVDVIVHPSSVAIQLSLQGHRVFVYCPSTYVVDSQSSLGMLCKAVGFTSIEELVTLRKLSSHDYWSRLILLTKQKGDS